MSPTFRVVNLGCKVNRVEADTLRAALLDAGAVEGADGQPCDLVVVNTCTVTAEADTKARKALHRALREDPSATVLATGCAVYLDPEAFSSLGKHVVCQPDRTKVVGQALEVLGLAHCPQPSGSSAIAQSPAAFERTGSAFRSRAGIKVQDGCANACTYCIVHVARGPVWHKPLHEAVAEIAAADAAGVREVVLTGVNLGSYPDLCGLLEGAFQAAAHARIRLSSIEPLDVDSHLIELIASADGRICRHLHMPLQSGCEKTLSEMARPYAPGKYREIAQALHAAMPQISISTDVIAGFPGETDADFDESFAFCREMGFSKMHVFRYSRRPGTPAAMRDDQVAPEIIASRAAELRALGSAMRAEDASKRKGSHEQILLEAGGHATSESYFDCEPSSGEFDTARAGELVSVRITGSKGDKLLVEEA